MLLLDDPIKKDDTTARQEHIEDPDLMPPQLEEILRDLPRIWRPEWLPRAANFSNRAAAWFAFRPSRLARNVQIGTPPPLCSYSSTCHPPGTVAMWPPRSR